MSLASSLWSLAHSSWRICALGILALCVSSNVEAAPVDCDKLVHSTVPYEATMKVGEVELKYQVERSATGLTTVLIRNLDGRINKLENQGPFPKSMTLPTGDTASFDYSVPTDKPLYEQAVKKIHMQMKQDKEVLVDSDATVDYLPDEKIKVGDCTYDTKHYVQTTAKNGRESRSELWFAPGLELSLKTVTTIKAGDKQMSQETDATNLTTSFLPFK